MNNEITETINLSDYMATERYEVISNETLSDCIQKDLNISGSLLSQSHFKNVTFSNCAFFGSRIEKCTFIGVTFENCTFQFSHLQDCTFISCTFKNCRWTSTGINGSDMEGCLLDVKTMFYVSKYDNKLQGCFRDCLLYTSPSPRDQRGSRMPSSA